MTPLSDPIGDLLTRMRNAQRVRKTNCLAPWSRIKEQLLDLMKKEGLIKEVETVGEGIHKNLVVTFLEEKSDLEMKRISKPGRRVYQGSKDLKPILQGFGLAVITTSQGLMTDKEARENNVGGEVLCTIS